MKRILLLIKDSPEYTGFNFINKQVANSKLINANYLVKTLSISISRKGNNNKIFVLVSNLFKIFSFSINFKPDVVYFTISPLKAFLRDFVYVVLLKIFKQKIVYHLHGKGIKQKASESKMYSLLYKFTFRNSYVICLSENLTGDISEVYAGQPIILNNGIPDSQIPIPHKVNEQTVTKLLFLSNYIVSKGILELIQALKIVQENGYKFCATFVGDYIEFSYEQLQNFISQNNLKGKVNIVGPKYGKDKIEYLRTSDVFIYPTLNDAFPLVLLEAMQFALPIIAYDEGGIKDIIIDGCNGYLVEKLNKNDLADKITKLLTDHKLRHLMGENGQNLFYQKYTLEIFEKNLLSIFRRVMIDV